MYQNKRYVKTIAAIVCIIVLTVILAACMEGASGQTPTPTPYYTFSFPPLPTPTPTPSVTPTPTGVLYATVTLSQPGSVLNLRSGPGTSNSILTTIPNGAKVEVISKGTWSQVKYNGIVGYVQNSYLTYDN